jgi:hypothetical protein
MAGCPWWAWATITAMGLCLGVVGLHALVEILWALRRQGWLP